MSHECGTSNHCQSAQTASSEHAHNNIIIIIIIIINWKIG